MTLTGPAAQKRLRQLSRHFYVSCELSEDQDLDRNDHVAVLRRAFTTSDCYAFAAVLHQITGWKYKSLYAGRNQVHGFLEAANGRFVDASGWVGIRQFTTIYGPTATRIVDAKASSFESELLEFDDDGDLTLMIRDAISLLPWAPFNTKSFQALLSQYNSRMHGPDRSEMGF